LAPVGYLDFLCLLSNATVVLTDSGGIQEETTALRVPCLTSREATERPLTVGEGSNQIVGQTSETILAAVRDVLTRRCNFGRVPALWDGHAAKRIVEVLLSEKSKVNCRGLQQRAARRLQYAFPICASDRFPTAQLFQMRK